MKNLLLCLSILTFGACVFADDTDNVPSITHAELVQALKAKSVVLLDCNGLETYNSGHIPGAIHLASAGNELASKLPSDKNAFIVVYCGSDTCPAWKKGAEALQKLGYTGFKHYHPGIKGWKESGEATEPPQAAK